MASKEFHRLGSTGVAATSSVFEKDRWYLRPRVRSGSLNLIFVFDLTGCGNLIEATFDRI